MKLVRDFVFNNVRNLNLNFDDYLQISLIIFNINIYDKTVILFNYIGLSWKINTK